MICAPYFLLLVRISNNARARGDIECFYSSNIKLILCAILPASYFYDADDGRGMASEIETCAAAFFRASGKDVVTADEFVMDASLKLKWMPPSKAKNLLKLLESEGAVSCRNSYVRLSPELGDVEVPLMYKPSAELVARLSKPIEAAKPAPAQAGTTSGTEKKPAAAQKPAREEKDAFHMLMEAAEKAGIPR